MGKYVVTGGAGFIGSHLSRRLLSDGHEVIGVDNFLTGSNDNVSALVDNPKYTFIKANLSETFPAIEGSVDGIFHFASPASPNKKSERSYINHPIETLMVNSVGTRNVLEYAKDHNSRVLYASSSEVYGDPSVSPQPESYWGNVNPNGVRSVYDEGKRFGEAIMMAYHRTHRVDSRIVRIFNTYGENMQKDDGRVVSNFINQAIHNEPITVYGDGSQTRSFCYVSDLVEGIVRLMYKDDAAGECINLGNPTEYTIKELAELIIRLTSSSSEIVYEELPQDDPMRRRPDITRAKNLLGWEPVIGVEEGLKKTIEYFKSV